MFLLFRTRAFRGQVLEEEGWEIISGDGKFPGNIVE